MYKITDENGIVHLIRCSGVLTETGIMTESGLVTNEKVFKLAKKAQQFSAVNDEENFWKLFDSKEYQELSKDERRMLHNTRIFGSFTVLAMMCHYEYMSVDDSDRYTEDADDVMNTS